MKKYYFLFVLTLFSPLAGLSADSLTPVSTYSASVTIPGRIEYKNGSTIHKKDVIRPLSMLDTLEIVFKSSVTSGEKDKILCRVGYYRTAEPDNLSNYQVWVRDVRPIEEVIKELQKNPDIISVVRKDIVLSKITTPSSISTSVEPRCATNTERPYATPDWKSLVPDKDYVADEVVLTMNNSLTDDEQDRVIQKMILGIGLIERGGHWHFKNGGSSNLFTIKITNGMSVESVVGKFKDVSCIKSVGPNILIHPNWFQ
jgi:hypothetical protein